MSEGDQFVETFRRLSLRGSRALAAGAPRTEDNGEERARHAPTPIVNPFDRRPSQSNPAQTSPAKSDVTMEDVSGDFGTIMNAPALPKPPRYKGSSMQERREFLRAYETYFSALSAFQTAHNRPFVQPVGSCIEQGTKEIIAKFTFAKNWQDVTEDEWVNYFLQAKRTSFEDYAALDSAMQKLMMDTKLAEAESRVNRLLSNMYKILKEHNMVDVMFEREQKKLVKYLVAALAPLNFKKEIQRRVDQEQNKNYKSNVIEFCRWLTELLATFMMWEKSLVSNTEHGHSNPQTQSRPGKGTGGGGSSNKHGGGSHKARLDDKQVASSQVPQTQSDTRRAKQFRWPCFKCKSHDHLVKDCPHAEPADAKRLVQEFRASKPTISDQDSQAKAPMKRLAATGVSESRELRVNERGKLSDRGTVEATVYGITVRASLLDSGADAPTVSRGFISELHSKGCFVPIITREKPQEFDPFGPGTVKLFKQARFEKVMLHTSVGPLVLRNLECWIDESDKTQALTVGRSVMVALGYSTDGLLVTALERQSEYVLPPGNLVEDTPSLRAQQLREIACLDPPSSEKASFELNVMIVLSPEL